MTHSELTLEKRIEAILFGLDAHMSVFADDLKGNVIERDADHVFESASTIKIFILGCLFDLAKRKEADLEEMLEYREDFYVNGSGMLNAMQPGTRLRAVDAATLMIICSDNIATNMLIDYLGIGRINDFILRIGCGHTRLNRMLRSDTWGEMLGAVTPRDMGRFFALLGKRQLLGPEEAAQMLGIFRNQHYNKMLTGQLPLYYLDAEESGADPELIWTATKSGSMDACRNDGGLIHTPYGEYVLVLMCTDFHNKLEFDAHPAFLYGQQISRTLFDQYLALEGRFR